MNDLVVAPMVVASGHWLDAILQGLREQQPQVLITVAQAKGSTPRDAGAKMWVDASGAHDTIGGGHLEQQAIETARQMLAGAQPRRQVIHYLLGPSLGQCCGGAVWLAFEYLDQTDLPWCQQLSAALGQGLRTQRIVHLMPLPDGDGNVIDPVSRLAPVQLNVLPTDAPVAFDALSATDGGIDAEPPATVWDENDGVMTEFISQPTLNVVVCGAGHVGRAIVRLLGDLPVRVTWLDPRSDWWPAEIPGNVTCIEGDADDVVDCPDNAYWLVLTHSHALDLEIVQTVFQRNAFRFLGLIGSKTKKARFVSRLKQRFPQELVERMTCPIGLVATSSKLPSVIAISVVAQLIPLISHTANASD